MAQGRCPLPLDEAGGGGDADLIEGVRRECARLRPWLLRAPRGLLELPDSYRRAGVFALLAALRLLSDIEEAGPLLLRNPPRLGTAARLGLLLRARWLGLYLR
jgi:phytoene/squalene synthetase